MFAAKEIEKLFLFLLTHFSFTPVYFLLWLKIVNYGLRKKKLINLMHFVLKASFDSKNHSNINVENITADVCFSVFHQCVRYESLSQKHFFIVQVL